MINTILVTNGLNNNGGKITGVAERLDWSDLYATCKVNTQLNSAYELSFTATYSEQYKEAFNMLELKRSLWLGSQTYTIQQVESSLDSNGLPTKQVTATAYLIDLMKNVRIDPKQPTEDSPDVSGSDSGGSDTKDDQQVGTVVKQTDLQQTYSLQNRLDTFLKNNDQGITYELHGNFPQIAVECSGSLYEWLGSNLSSFGAFYIPDNQVLKIYDLQSLQHPSDKEYRYLHNVTSVDVQQDGNEMYNDFDVYGGKMEKDITTASGGGISNGVSEPINGDWTPVIRNAAGLVGENLSASDINLVLAQINLESSGRESVIGGTDGLADGPAKGLLQFKQATFDYYCRPPYNNIMHGLDQIIALFNVPNWRTQITGRHGWSPHGAPVSKAPIQQQQQQPTGNSANQIVDFCKSFVGKVPYVWGGSSTSGWDCSGFVCYVLNHFGISTPRTNTVGLESKGQQVSPPYQTGDLLFWGAHGSSYHVSIAMDSMWRVGADNYQDGTVYRTIASWPPSFAVRIPQFAALAGGNATNTSDDSTTLSTTTQTYYALHYHYTDQDSVNQFGLHRGPQVLMDSVYDLNTLKKLVDTTVAHQPPTSITNNEIGYDSFSIGETCRVIVREQNINEMMTLMGITYNPFDKNGDVPLSWNNTGLAMKDVIYAMSHDLQQVNNNVGRMNFYGATGAVTEDHFKNLETNTGGQGSRPPVLNASQVEAINKFVNS